MDSTQKLNQDLINDNYNFTDPSATKQQIQIFSNLKVLLVDDQHSFIVMMKSMLTVMGFTKIDIANNADQAIKLTKKHSYDIYLFDYNLGQGLNGRQVIEKLHKNKKILPHAIVLIITGDNSRAMVLSAIEQEPDDYIIKPFSLIQFKERLHNAIHRKHSLSNVYKALYEDNNEELIKALNSQLASNTPYYIYCRCLLANCYVKENKFDLAKATLQEGLALTDSPYLKITLGKVYYSEQNYQDAIKELSKIVEKHPMQMEALKFLTFSYIESGQNELANKTIKRAVLMSPMSVSLLQLQIDISLKNKDYLQARDTIALLLDVNKYYPKEVENLLSSFVQCEIAFVQNSGDVFHISNVQKYIRNIMSKFKKHVNADRFDSILFDQICTARIQMVKGENIKAKRTLYKAYASCDEKDTSSTPVMGQMYLGFQQVGEYEIAEQIKKTIEANKADSDNLDNSIASTILTNCVDNYVNDPQTKERSSKYKELNEQGINYYKLGKLDEALECFKDALKKVPSNTNAILNKIQVLIDICERTNQTKERNYKLKVSKLISEAEIGLQSLDGLNLTEAQYARTSLLKTDIANLKR